MASSVTLQVAEQRGAAMGSATHLVATGRRTSIVEALRTATTMIVELERLWSRFLPSSDVSRLNALSPGRPIEVDPRTALLIERACEAWRRTDGRFDPTVLRAMTEAGYDRDFPTIEATSVLIDDPGPAGAGCEAVIVDRAGATVTLSDGVGFDPGGLGKGLAADLVTEAVLDHDGVDGLLVNIGGDLRCAGQPPAAGDGAWVVACPAADDEPDIILRLADGAVATSTSLRRRWQTRSGPAHHLIDPSTGRPAPAAARTVTVVASNACDAETLATAVAVEGELPPDRSMLGCAAVRVIRTDGTLRTHGPMHRYTSPSPVASSEEGIR